MAAYNMFGLEISPEANAKRRETVAALGADALRQMNPWRDPGGTPQKASTDPRAGNGTGAQPQPQPSPTNPARERTPLTALPTYAMKATGSVQNPMPGGNLGYIDRSLMRSGKELVTPSNQVAPAHRGVTPEGIGFEGQNDGSRAYTMGKPGQDGYGKMTVMPGTGTATPLAKMPRPSGMTIIGSAGDVERFNRPVGITGPGTGKRLSLSAPPAGGETWADWYDGLGAAYDKRMGVSPSQSTTTGPGMNELTKGLENLDWRTKEAIIMQRMKGANDVNVESMKEDGANRRTALAQGVEMEKFKGQNDVARETLESSKKFDQARIGTEEINQRKGQAEVEALNQIKAARDAFAKDPSPENESIYRGLIGKFEREAQYGVVKKYDDVGNVVGEQLFNKQTGEPKTSSGQQPTQAPQAALDYLKKNPGQRAAFKQKYGYLPPGV